MQQNGSGSVFLRGVGAAVVFSGLVLVATSVSSCAPGNLDCEAAPAACAKLPPAPDVDAAPVPVRADAAVAAMDAPPRAGDTAAVAPGNLGAMPLPACAMITGVGATVAGVERDLIAKKCGTSGCHAPPLGGTSVTDLATLPLYERLRGAAPKGASCTTGAAATKIIDRGAVAKSFLLLKLDTAPKCVDGSTGGAPMGVLAGLDATMTACLRAYVDAVAK